MQLIEGAVRVFAGFRNGGSEHGMAPSGWGTRQAVLEFQCYVVCRPDRLVDCGSRRCLRTVAGLVTGRCPPASAEDDQVTVVMNAMPAACSGSGRRIPARPKPDAQPPFG